MALRQWVERLARVLSHLYMKINNIWVQGWPSPTSDKPPENLSRSPSTKTQRSRSGHPLPVGEQLHAIAEEKAKAARLEEDAAAKTSQLVRALVDEKGSRSRYRGHARNVISASSSDRFLSGFRSGPGNARYSAKRNLDRRAWLSTRLLKKGRRLRVVLGQATSG